MNACFTKDDLRFAQSMRELFISEIPADIRGKGRRGEPFSAEDHRVSQRILNTQGVAVPRWPVEWGGRDWTPVERHLWSVELSLAHVPPPLGFNVAMVGPVIATFGSEEQKERFLPATANLDIWWCQGFSEPEAGSDLAGLRTTAVRDGDHYVVNGQKTWTTYAQHADWIFCLVRTDPAAKKQQGISFLLIDMRTPGVTVRPIRLLDGSPEVNEVFLDNVRVPADQLVGEENRGWSYAKFLLTNERTGVARIGLIKSRILRLKQVAASAAVHGRPLLEDPAFRSRLTQIEVETTALEMSVLRVLAGETRNGEADPVSSVLKLRGSQIEQSVSELLVDALGQAALVDRRSGATDPRFAPLPEAAADALPTYLNWRKASIYSGSNEVQRSIIARSILGL